MHVQSIDQNGQGVQVGQFAAAATAEAAPAAAVAAAGVRTPEVIRGATVRGGRVSSLGVDWLNMSGPAGAGPSVREIFRHWFGEPERYLGLRNFYRCWFRYPAGAYLLEQPSQDGMQPLSVQIPGSALALLGGAGSIALLVELSDLGFQASRLDLAVDFRGERITLIEDCHAACSRGELRLVRSWKPIGPEFTGHEETGYTVYMGKRGNKDSALVRVYDKGLESATCKRRQWVRWEAELHGARARQAQQMLVVAYRIGRGELREWPEGLEVENTWTAQLAAIAFGVVDFRAGKGRFCRTKRAAWWDEVMRGLRTVRLRGRPRTRPNAAATLRAVRRQWGGLAAAVAEAAGVSFGKVMDVVMAGCEVTRRARASPIVWEIVNLYRGGEVVAA